MSEQSLATDADELVEVDAPLGVDETGEVDQPGLSKLRAAVANRLPGPPRRSNLEADGIAGLNIAIANVPDGLASGLLAGVNPIYGLYACIAGPIGGGLFASTRLMVITTTSASALAAGQALSGVPAGSRANALFLMVMLVGLFQIAFGLLRLGRLARFVSHSVMTGFLLGIAVLTVLSQLPTVTGYEPVDANAVTETAELAANAGQFDWMTVVVGLVTVGLAVILPRTRLGNLGTLVAIAIPSVAVLLLQWDSVEKVRDVGEIPRGLPAPYLPMITDPALTLDLVTGAMAVAVIILVQAAGVSQTVPNPDGSPTSASGDFMAQGAANLASGFFRGLPVGGSLSSTALSVLAGAQSRWAAIYAGLWTASIILVFPQVVAVIAMPALAALLMVASASTINPAQIRSVWRTGWPSGLAIATTFLATLLLPIQAAVGIGVTLSALLYLLRAGNDVTVVQLVRRPDGRIEEREAPERAPSHEVTVLDVYGHLFFAGARALEARLPNPDQSERPVVMLRMRGRGVVEATLTEVLMAYAKRLEDVGGRLYLSGISERAYAQMIRTGKLDVADPVRIFQATPIVGQSSREAHSAATAWLVRADAADDTDTAPPNEDDAQPAADTNGASPDEDDTPAPGSERNPGR